MSVAPSPRVVVFDMDETLGHFVQLGGFWDVVQSAHGRELPTAHFIEMMSLYPEAIRPGMEVLLAQLVAARSNGTIHAIILYTNNQGPESWAQMIAEYFSHMAGKRVFDMIIPAYSVGGRRVARCRSGHAKSPSDLLRCTGLPDDTRICFIDDQDHPPMISDRVYYIRVPPYVETLLVGDMAQRYISAYGAGREPEFRQRMGRAIMAARHLDGQPRSSGGERDHTEWIRQHIGRFISLSQPEVTRRRSRRRGGGLTRRRRHSMLWL